MQLSWEMLGRSFTAYRSASCRALVDNNSTIGVGSWFTGYLGLIQTECYFSIWAIIDIVSKSLRVFRRDSSLLNAKASHRLVYHYQGVLRLS